jgi:hypothetical protein
VEAGQIEELQELLLDYRWLRAKLKAMDVHALLISGLRLLDR